MRRTHTPERAQQRLRFFLLSGASPRHRLLLLVGFQLLRRDVLNLVHDCLD
jgi:hypothetical protein